MRVDAVDRRRLSGPGMRAFLAITDLWRLSDQERRRALGDPTPEAYGRWISAARERSPLALDVEVLTRISAVLGIHQALGTLHLDGADAAAWLRRQNCAPPFGGRAPFELVVAGTLDALLAVRRFLDGLCVGGGAAPNEADADVRPYEKSEIAIST